MTEHSVKVVLVEERSRFDKVLTVIGLVLTAVAVFWPERNG